ncbi:unnamed protein product [Peronospora belbahrii]|uniref:Uncharacterized protein n=1 Tax=Peronospora belbahrii TaxID=622444 RepID=A0AAU9KZ35_9STRA|nr:unnamed protein product [Peronospora belbahrii]
MSKYFPPSGSRTKRSRPRIASSSSAATTKNARHLRTCVEEVAQLESEFAFVLQRWQRQNEKSAEAFRDGKRCITPQDLYAELTTVRSSLVEEQQQLNLRIADRHLFRQRLQQLYEPTR